MRLAYTFLAERGSKKAPAGASFVTLRRHFVTRRVPGLDRFEVRTIVVTAVTGDDR